MKRILKITVLNYNTNFLSKFFIQEKIYIKIALILKVKVGAKIFGIRIKRGSIRRIGIKEVCLQILI